MPGRSVRLSCVAYGDAALLVNVEADCYEERWAGAQALARALRGPGHDGIVDVLASFEDVLVAFDPLVTDADRVAVAVDGTAVEPLPPFGRTIDVPVVYGGEYGPDLQAVAAELSLDPTALVELHTSQEWTVRFVASPVGAPFLDGPEFPVPVRRQPVPRVRVSVGSIAISGHQTTAYPAASPSGWRIIGRTPLRLLRIGCDPPVAYGAGDRMRFVAIESGAWDGAHRPLDAP